MRNEELKPVKRLTETEMPELHHHSDDELIDNQQGVSNPNDTLDPANIKNYSQLHEDPEGLEVSAKINPDTEALLRGWDAHDKEVRRAREESEKS